MEFEKVTHDSRWNVYNAPLSNYQNFFADVLNGEKIENLISHTSSPVVIDLLAPSGTLVELFTIVKPKINNQLGIAVTLHDLRTVDKIETDKQLGIVQIAGDITQSTTQDKIKQALNGKKADLIIERALRGIINLPQKPEFYARSLQKLWSILNVNGSMLLQFPYNKDLSDMRVNPLRFVEKFKDTGIFINHQDDSKSFFHTLHIKRLPESPQRLPL